MWQVFIIVVPVCKVGPVLRVPSYYVRVIGNAHVSIHWLMGEYGRGGGTIGVLNAPLCLGETKDLHQCRRFFYKKNKNIV